MPKIHLKKRILIDESGANVGALVPAYLSQAETFNKLKDEKIYQATLKSEIAKNLYDQLHALSQFTFANSPEAYIEIKNYDQWRKYVAMQIGWCDILEMNGEIIKWPFSWSLDAFESEEQFKERLYNPAIDYQAELLGMFREDLIMKSRGYSLYTDY